jgi:pantoate--beta-alanine ligase
MLRADTLSDLARFRQSLPPGTTLGLVPTMGALHEGHLALVRQARAENDLVAASVFVNPAQFTNPDDLAHYPRSLEADAALLADAGCDLLFAPAVADVYPEPPRLRLSFGPLETTMEGASRPGHFNGVGIVVAKLFHWVNPTRAYFGQKDLQQVAVIRRLIRDLSFPVKLVRCPTTRASDGLALSSRNTRLTADERTEAPALFAALSRAQRLLMEGHPANLAEQAVRDFLARHPRFALDYVAVVQADTLEPVAGRQEPGQTAVCLAAQLGAVRLIDNVVF